MVGRTIEDRRQALYSLLDNLQPGVTQLILHPAVNSEELGAITGSAVERALDFALFAEEATRQRMRDRSIVLIGWRPIQRLFESKTPAALGAPAKHIPSPVGMAEFYAYDKSVPLDSTRGLIKETDAYSLFEVSFKSVHDETVPGLFLLPKSKEGKLPCVICIHGHMSNKSELLPVMEALAKEGYASIAIDVEWHGDRHEKGESMISLEFYRTRDAIVQTVIDLRRTMDFLQAQPEIDGNRLGYIGASLGGILGLVLAGVDTRIDAMVCVGGGGSLQAFFRFLQVPDELAQAWAPIDPVNFAESISPTALLMMHSKTDMTVPPSAAKAIYERVGQPKKLLWYKKGHVMPHDEIVEESVKWFKEHMK